MATLEAPANDMLGTAKSREVQRAMFAEMRGDKKDAAEHYLAAAHMEIVLAKDHARANKKWLHLRSMVSAASCFWMAGQIDVARKYFRRILRNNPDRKKIVQEAVASLKKDYPAK